MSNRCRFARECGLPCPKNEKLIDLVGPCLDERGEVCGPAMAYGTLIHDFKGLQELDEAHPIVGSFRLGEVPDSRAVPIEIREQWMGVTIPVRFPLALSGGGVEATTHDLVLSLLAHGKFEAAQWFCKPENQQHLFPPWCFMLREGDLALGGPRSSGEHYGAYLDEERQTAIEGVTAG